MKTKKIDTLKRDTLEELMLKIESCSKDFEHVQIIQDNKGDWYAFCTFYIQDSDITGSPEKEASQPSVPQPAPQSPGVGGLPAPANEAKSNDQTSPSSDLSVKQEWRLDKMGYSKEQISNITKQQAIEIITAASGGN